MNAVAKVEKIPQAEEGLSLLAVISRPTRESQWAFSVAARQESTNVSDALPKPGRNSGERPNTCANGTPGRLAGVSRIENRAWQYRVRGLRVSPMGCPNGFFVGASL
jgi:hypothetical protein